MSRTPEILRRDTDVCDVTKRRLPASARTAPGPSLRRYPKQTAGLSLHNRPASVVAGRIFSRGGTKLLFPMVTKNIFPGGAKSGEILFCPPKNKKTLTNRLIFMNICSAYLRLSY